MVFSNDPIDATDHHNPHADADETATLLGGRGTNANSTSTGASRGSRFGSVGFLIAFVVLSSSAFVFLLNQQKGTTFSSADVGAIEVQVEKAPKLSLTGVLSSTPMLTSSFKAHDDELYFTYDDFSKGGEGLGGTPIFIAQYDDYVQQLNTDLGDLIIKKAKEVNALILIVTSGASVEEAIEDVEKKQGCVQKENDPHYCLLFIFEGKISSEGKPLLVVSTVDENHTLHPVVTVDPTELNGLLSGNDGILGATYASDSVRRSSFVGLSDGPLKQPKVLKMSTVEGYCPEDAPILGATQNTKSCPPSTDNVHVLTMEEGNHKTNIAKQFQTRLFNGQLPGPTIRVKAGDTLRVQFQNKLKYQEGQVSCYLPDGKATNVYCQPNDTNIHYHGFHGSGERPSDDVEMKIAPGSDYSYMSVFPKDHMPGTHWVHTHSHGASALQVGGGAALALIVEDDPERFPIPPEVVTAKETLLFVQYINPKKSRSTGNSSFVDPDVTDSVFQFEVADDCKDAPNLCADFRLVNGQYKPELTIQSGTWQRFRVVYAGWLAVKGSETLNIKFKNNIVGDENCETYLLAKDGIYLHDYPRKLETFPVPLAGTADIMVRCNAGGTYDVTHFENDEVLFTMRSEGPHFVSEGPTLNFFNAEMQKQYFPPYLQDARQKPVDPACSCDTILNSNVDNSINGVKYQPNKAVHTIKLNEVVERTIIGVNKHPYHQHVYPFQLNSGFAEDEWTADKNGNILDASQGGYFMNGDWHDNIRTVNQETITVKYQTHEILGKMMLHCHRLNHEDSGMMSQEKISRTGKCECDPLKMSYEELEHYSNKISTAVRLGH